MADAKISALTAVATPAETDQHEVNQGGVSKRETNAQILSLRGLLVQAHTSADVSYTTGGSDITFNSTRSGGTVTATAVDVVWTASGGNLGGSTTGRYFTIYDDTSAADNLLASYDYTATFTVASGETMTVDFGASLFTLA